MGNSSSQKAALQAKNRRYSRSSGFAHWMDNIKDKKVLKINMKQTSETQGTFTLTYVDESSDDFLSTKACFTFSGTYQHMKEDEARDVFGVNIAVSPRGNIIIDDDKEVEFEAEKAGVVVLDERPKSSNMKKAGPQIRSDSLFVTSAKDRLDPESKRLSSQNTTSASNVTSKMTRFFTEKLVCKLSEGNSSQSWTITQSTAPDCIETAAAEIVNRVSWTWTGQDGAKVSHKAPPGTLDFIGEETFEPNGASSIDLKIRIPQLNAGHNPAIVALNEVGGWKLGKKSML